MADPTLALQQSIFEALRSAPAVAGGRVYDRVPERPTFPYVTIGEGDTLGDDNECFDSSECNVSIHVWSREPGMVEGKQLAAVIRNRLSTELTVTGFHVPVGEYVITRYLKDADGLTTHVVLEFRYLIDHEKN